MLDCQTTDRGVILPVYAQPGARKNAVTGVHAGRLKVAVTQAPEKGKANQAIVDMLAGALRVKKSQVMLLSGETSRQKKFLIAGLSLEDLRARLGALAGPGS